MISAPEFTRASIRSVPKLSANSQADAIIVAWGNPKAPSAVSAKATYDATQLLVQHFSQDFKDATSNANHGVSSGVKTAPNGPVGESGIFDGNAKLAVEKSATLKFPSGASLTLSTWVKPSGNDNANLIQIGEGKTGGWNYLWAYP
ncbi:MAG: hypothetical protein EBR87_03505 [Cytophagia bacterium]|nr:hypothetical protein [Cytophagia bacterium]